MIEICCRKTCPFLTKAANLTEDESVKCVYLADSPNIGLAQAQIFNMNLSLANDPTPKQSPFLQFSNNNNNT